MAATSAQRRLGRLERPALQGVMVRAIVNYPSFWRPSPFPPPAAPRRLGRLERPALQGVMVREIVNYSSFWRSSTFSSTVDPTIYLLAFGFGFGSLVSTVGGYGDVDSSAEGTA